LVPAAQAGCNTFAKADSRGNVTLPAMVWTTIQRSIKINKFFICPLLFFLMFFAGCLTPNLVLPRVDSKILPHNDSEKKYCNVCHVGNTQEVYVNTSELCIRCHPMGVNDHPLGVKLSGEIKTWLPLEMDREVACHTCHDQHNKTQQKAMLRTDFNHLCKECHNK